VETRTPGSGDFPFGVIRQPAASELLRDDWGIASDVWSATSFTLLHRDGESTARWNLLHPTEEPQRPYVARLLVGHDGPVVAATDYVKTFAEQIRPFVERRFHALGTDGYGRSDTRKQLRAFDLAYKKFSHPGNGYTYIGFNLKDPRFADRRVRQAFAHAINKREVIEGVRLGLAREGS